VLPPQQRLGAVDATRSGVHDRLVVQDELLGGDRAAQLGLQLEAAQEGRVHAVLVEAVAARALVLGAVERDVGVAQDLVGRRLGGAVDQRDAGRGGDGHAAALELERLRQRVEQVAGHLPRGLG
jgi:hypothetical protein